MGFLFNLFAINSLGNEASRLIRANQARQTNVMFNSPAQIHAWQQSG